jgi:hypothetical protein
VHVVAKKVIDEASAKVKKGETYLKTVRLNASILLQQIVNKTIFYYHTFPIVDEILYMSELSDKEIFQSHPSNGVL